MIVAPIVGVFILLISSNHRYMGDLKNNNSLLIAGILGLLVVLLLGLGFVRVLVIQ
jgi:Mn2+/Fe2+ NRAMP family transporter